MTLERPRSTSRRPPNRPGRRRSSTSTRTPSRRHRMRSSSREMAMRMTSRRAARVLALLLAVVGLVWATQARGVRAQERRTVWDKVFTADQAALGKTEYDTHCAGCHVKDLSGRDGGGEGPQLAGAAFTKKWDLQSVNQLYTEMKTRMPRNQPGSL